MAAEAGRIRLDGWLGAFRGNLWGLADQAVLSATSFALTLFLARQLSPSAFGTFVLAYTALLALANVQMALVTQPHNVLGATLREREYSSYTSAAAVIQLLLAAVAAIAAVVAGVLTLALGLGADVVIAALAPAIVGSQLLEFARRVLYTEERLPAAFAIDFLGYGGLVVALGILLAAGTVTGSASLVALGVTTAIGAVWGAWFLRRRLAFPAPTGDAARRNWTFGRWLLGSWVAFWLSSYLYLYLAAAMLGTDASGVLKASQTILGPLNVPLLFLEVVLPIRFARRLEAGGRAALDAGLRRAYVATAGPVLAYCMLVVLLAEPILRALYGDKYASDATVVRLFAGYYAATYAAQLLAAALNARQSTRAVFVANAAAAVWAVVFGWLFIELFDVNGAVTSMLVGVVLMIGILAAAHSGRLTIRRFGPLVGRA